MTQRAIKKKSGVYAYLHSTKVLETGSDQDIAVARKAYWNEYKARWRQRHRKAQKQITISLTASEATEMTQATKKHKRSLTRFIKESCLANIRKQYLAPDPLALATIRQLLAMNYNALQKLFDENRVPFEAGRALLSQMAALEQKVIEELYNPKEIKGTVV